MKDKNFENLVVTKDFFVHYTIISFIFMAFSVGVFLLNPSFIMGLHSKIFNIPIIDIGRYLYIFIGIAKFIIIFGGLIPAIALHLIVKKIRK